jgi:autotransporter-associated beta strand protein
MTVTNPIQLNFTAVNAFNTKTHVVTLSGLISGARGLSKIGSGKLTLNGNNTYAGSTTVNAGTLLINGSQTSTSATTVAVGTTLGGVGTLAGPLNVNGSIAPGNGIGTFSAASTTINGSYACEVNGATADVIAATNLTLGATSALAVSETSGTFPIVIATYSGTLSGTFATVTPGYTVNYSTPGTIILTQGTVFDSWAASKGLDGTPGKEKGLADDPDGDGRNNVYEFAFDGNPLSGANDGKVISKIATVGADQVLTLTLPVRTGATFSASTGDLLSALIDGIYYRVDGDVDLGTFASSISEVTGGDATTIQTGLPTLSTGWTYRTFSAPGNVTTVPKSFLRAKISETP